MAILNIFNSNRKNYENNLTDILKQSSNLLKRIRKHQKSKVIDLKDVREIINEIYSIIFNYDELIQKIENDENLKSSHKETLLDKIKLQKKPILDLEIKTKKYEEELQYWENLKTIKENPNVIDVGDKKISKKNPKKKNE